MEQDPMTERTLDHEGTEDSTRKELEQVSAAWDAAMVSNDAAAIGRFMADDWVIVSQSGVSRREDFLALVASGDLTHEAFRGELVAVRRYGETAIVTGRTRNTGRYRDQPFSADEWTTDVFVRRNGTWLCEHSHITSVTDSASSSSA
jgi:ketosteroid isomerase-like protein